MPTELLYSQSELLIVILLLGLLVGAGELGFRIGQRRRDASTDHVRAQAGNIQGALLGLFALLLGFTFAMALSRFDARKQTVVQESNAIGTAALRARLLPAEQQAEASELFRRYVQVRLDDARRPNLDTPARQQLEVESKRLQDRLWLGAMATSQADPRSVPAGLFVQSVNDLIDRKAERDAAFANHVPESVLMLLFAFACLVMVIVGHGNGMAGTRAKGSTAILAVLITLVILVIVDLDRPGRGLIRVSEAGLIELQRSLNAGGDGVAPAQD